MRIVIHRRLFTEDPALRFSRSFRCSPNVWREVWRRYKILEYTEDEAKEYLMIMLHVPISHKRFNRWVKRTEVYTRAQVAIKSGVKEVLEEYFKPFTPFVLREISKNQKCEVK